MNVLITAPSGLQFTNVAEIQLVKTQRFRRVSAMVKHEGFLCHDSWRFSILWTPLKYGFVDNWPDTSYRQ